MFRTAERRNVVRDPPHIADRFACFPGATKIPDAFSVPMEHVPADGALLRQSLMLPPLFINQLAEGIGEGKHPPGLILCRAGLETSLTRLPIDVPPLERQDFALHAPTGDVRERDDGLQRRGSRALMASNIASSKNPARTF